MRCGKLREGRDVAVCNRYGDGDARVCECAEDVGVRVEELHAVDGCLGFQEGRHRRRWREVVGDCAVVDADFVRWGGKGNVRDEVAS